MTESIPEVLPGPALLFCPADRPDRFAKAAAAADAVILDLEDGVAPADKEMARQHLIDASLDPDHTIVRINPVGTSDHDLDLVAVARTPYRTVMLAKAERGADVRQLAALFHTGTEPGVPALRVIALCETALGVLNAPDLAAEAATVAMMWGAEDLVVSLGGRSSRHRDGRYRDVSRSARARVLLASAAYGRPAIDAVHLDIADLDGLRAEVEDAAASGFAASACIHPSQVAVVRAAYKPRPEDVERASALLRAAQGAAGVFAFEGRMVDEPILNQARRLLRLAGVSSHHDPA